MEDGENSSPAESEEEEEEMDEFLCSSRTAISWLV